MKSTTKQIFFFFFSFSFFFGTDSNKMEDLSYLYPFNNLLLKSFKITCILCSRNRAEKTQCKWRCNNLINATSSQTDVSFNSKTSQKLHSLLDSLDNLKNTLRHYAPRKKCLYSEIFCFERRKIRTIDILNTCTFTQ